VDENRNRLDQVLDGVGLLVLGWAAVLWWLGSPQVQEGADRGRLSVGLVVLAVPLLVTVLATFGRRPGRGRWLTAVPLLAGLLAVAIWRLRELPMFDPTLFVEVQPPVASAGTWDGAAATLVLAAVLLLGIREYRLTRRLLAIVTVAVLVSMIGQVASVAELVRLLGDLDGTDGWFRLGLAIMLPAMAVAGLGLLLAAACLFCLWRDNSCGAAALMLWGGVVAVELAMPREIIALLEGARSTIAVANGRSIVSSLDWLVGLIAVAAAVLIAPVTTIYEELDRPGRARLLRGPLAVVALLVIVRLGAQLVAFQLLVDISPEPLSRPTEQLIAISALLGAVLILVIALRPQAGWAPLTMLAAVVLITVPLAIFLVPEAVRNLPDPELLRALPTAIVPPLRLWSNGETVQTFILPWLLLGLLFANRRRQGLTPPTVPTAA
jgi:hypothetical protein